MGFAYMRPTKNYFKKKPPARTPTVRRSSGASYDIRLAKSLSQTASADAATTWILCPWLDRFPKDTGVWLSVLAAHDANAGLLKALPTSKKSWPRVYAAVFAVDTLRPIEKLIRCLKSAGITGVINFPSASFIDGEAGAVLNGLSLGVDREIGFLEACSSEGLRIAGLTRSIQTAQRLAQLGVDFLIAHGGPPTRNNPEPSQDVARLIEDVARAHNTPVIPMSRIHNWA